MYLPKVVLNLAKKKKRKNELGLIDNFHFSISQKNELALRYTHS